MIKNIEIKAALPAIALIIEYQELQSSFTKIAKKYEKKYDNLFFMGYFNSPAGLGGLLNFGGKMISLLLQAYFEAPKLTKIIQAMKAQKEPDLGNGVYIKTDRHSYEYDLWKTAKFMRFMIYKLEEELR